MDTKAGNRIIVTGGAGFIGSNLVRRLLADGADVICIDNLSTGNYENIRDLMDDPSFSFMEHDVCEPVDLDADRIYHLACPASPVKYSERPVDTLMTCFLGALNMLSLATKTGARVLLSSTSEVYGDPVVHPQTEDYRGNVSCTGPRACYDEGKRVSESLFFDFARQYGTDIRVARIFNTYGPHMDPFDGRVIPNLICQALSGDPMTVYGDGSQTRSYCYIDDMVSGLIALMENEKCNGPVNLGNPSEMTVLDTAKLIRELTQSSSKIVFKDLPKDDPTKRRPDISLAKKVLDWAPEIAPRGGFAETIKYFETIKPENEQ